MAASVHVVARFLAKPGKEEDVRSILVGLVAPSRRELGCYQYDLLQNSENPRDFCFVERWEDDRALDAHGTTPHLQAARSRVEALVVEPPDVRRYRIL